ncbi:phage tail tape measure protein [Curtobacterium sp. MCLR17_034]|uniref:phage tail tape measure protein n=1 Tax=Curtobacterium sp. MCLR17_034 TaxID=2175623 RepID=UPI0011B654D8|nr:phage tail tape measure protein [Curtobacterium sp. MCLR17_034]
MVIIAERVVKVTIQASIANYVSGMEKVRKATADAAKESEKLEKFGQAATSVGTALVGIGAVAVGASAVIVKMAADFDAQMSKVQAATNASAADMGKFREQALTAGAAFGYTATQVTEAQVELGKAGLATRDILGAGLTGVLALAASDNVDLGKATQIAAVAMKQFNLEGSDVPHIADLLAAGAGKALGGVQELGDALNQSGLVASNFGFSIEETTGVLSSFADAGLLGSDAGTSLKSMLQMLANPSKESAQLMKSLGINVEDANGSFLGAADIAQVLQERLSGLSDAQRQQALSQIFGADAVRAATVLYKEGADGIQQYIDQNNDAGYAVDQAAKKSNNLNGDLKKLQSAFQSGLIEAGTAANGALRPLVQTMTQVVTAFNGLPEPVKGSALALTAVVGGATLLAGGLLIAIPKIVEFRAALSTLRDGGITARSSLSGVLKFLGGPWGIALSVAAAAAVVFANAQLQSAQYTQTLRDSLDSTTGALTKNTKELVSNALAAKTSFLGIEVAGSSAFDKANRLGLSLETVTKAAQGNTKAYKELLAVQKDIRGSDDNDYITKKYGEGLSDASGDITELVQSVEKQREAMSSARDQADQLADANGEAGDTSDEAASGLDSLAQSADDAAQSISDTTDAIKDFNSVQLDVNSAQRDFEASIDAVTDSVKENGQSLDVSTEKGRANAASLDSIAQSTLNYAGALYQQTGSQDQATGALESGRSSLIAALGQYGVTGAAAQRYADKILGTPKDWATLFQNNAPEAGAKADGYRAKLDALPAEKRTQINAATAQAQSAIQSVLNSLGLVQSKTITITTNQVTVATKQNTNGVFKASGGHVRGPGTETSDSIPAYLSDNEYVIQASSVRKYGTGFLDRVNAGRYADGGLVGHYAAGGSVAAQKAAKERQEAREKAAKARVEAREKAEAARLARQTDYYQFRTSMRTGSLTGMSAVQGAFGIATDAKYPERYRNSVARIAGRSEKAMIRLEKRSDSASKAVEKASDKLDGLKSSASSMSSSISGKLSDFSYGDYRSSTSLLRGLTSRASKLKQFQALLVTLRKNGLAPALLNEVASLGVDEGLPLAKSLAASSKSQIAAINTQYGSIGKTSTQIGNQVADANFGKLISAAEKQLRSANKNAASITRAISTESRKLQRLIGKALGVPGYQVGGYTGDGGAGQVAGLVHGQEFVVNRYATAANRGLLEAMNQGGNVRYMDPTRIVQAAPAAGNTYEQKNYITPIEGVDPKTVTTVLGRELGRQFAGMVS